jgi:hypothetical protein
MNLPPRLVQYHGRPSIGFNLIIFIWTYQQLVQYHGRPSIGFNQLSSETRGRDTHTTCEFSFLKSLDSLSCRWTRESAESKQLFVAQHITYFVWTFTCKWAESLGLCTANSDFMTKPGWHVSYWVTRWHRCCCYSPKLWCWFRYCQMNLEGYNTKQC